MRKWLHVQKTILECSSMLQAQLFHHAFTVAQTRSTEHTPVKLARCTYSTPFPHRQTLAPSITYTSYHRTSISLAAYIITVIKSGSLQKWWILYGRVLLPIWLPRCNIKLSEWHYSCKHLNVNDTQCLVSALIQQTHNSLNKLIKITPKDHSASTNCTSARYSTPRNSYIYIYIYKHQNSLKSVYSIPT